MKCCANCFGDRHLSRQLIPTLSVETANCSYCGGVTQQVVDPSALRDAFELLLGAYKQDAAGQPIDHWLREDWSLFRHPAMNPARSHQLLSDILGNADLVDQLVLPKESGLPGALAVWEEFRKELMHENRFFPRGGLNLDRLDELLGHLLLDPADIPGVWYRARLETDGRSYAVAEMGAPPKSKSSHGRANPAGIPYLYLATTALTAVSELRPHTGETATVATCAMAAGLKIVDLRDPRHTVSPFLLEDEASVVQMRGDIGFLEQLGEELTRPVLPQSAPIDYTPSQYLCEFIKKCGYEGVMYRSSVGDGVNIALFDPQKVTIGGVGQYRVTRVTVTMIG